MNLRVPTLKDCQEVRLWRNQCLETLRTPYPLTVEMQEEFYRDVICNRNSQHRYWCFWHEGMLVGFGDLTYIEWENHQAEISLIIDPELRGKGYGEEAVKLILDLAFNYLNLELVYGECYLSSEKLSSIKFWKKITEHYGGQQKYIRKGKYWHGQHYDTIYFDINKDEFNKTNK